MVGSVEAYHIHMHVPDVFVATVLERDGDGSRPCSPSRMDQRTRFLTHMRKALRDRDGDLELRSLRRGTLQMHNKAGVQ